MIRFISVIQNIQFGAQKGGGVQVADVGVFYGAFQSLYGERNE